MKTLLKYALLLITLFLAYMVPVSVCAAENQTIDLNISYVNPLYSDTVTEADLLPSRSSSKALYSTPQYVTTVEEAGNIMRQQMVEHSETAVVYIQTTNATETYLTDLSHQISNQALIHTGVPTEGDYLKWQFEGWNVHISGTANNNVYELTYTYTITYYTTAEQELAVDAAVEALLIDLNISTVTDYEKIRAIYNYICDNVSYDYTHLNDTSHKLKYTAYGALIDGTSVCQGYALLLYRLALEAGIDNRIIAGIGNDDNHGWNIVALDKLYYNADSTWDAGKTEYDYFLKSDSTFPNHTRFEEYATADFYSQFPMSATDYAATVPPSFSGGGSCGEQLAWNLTDEGELTLSGSGAMTDYTSTQTPWAEKAQYIQHIIIREGVTSISDNAFQDCFALLTITFEGDAPSIGSNTFGAVTATAYYPAANKTWTNAVLLNYGGTIEWVGTCHAGHLWDDGTVTTEPTTEANGVITYECLICKEFYTDYLPALPGENPTPVITRIFGSDRMQTALKVADKLKETLNVDTFDAIILTNGESFADALSGSYLANKVGAPILLCTKTSGVTADNLEFIQNNLSEDGVIYLLGGEAVIPASVEESLSQYTVKRLAGATRFETNLAILEEAGVEDEEILISMGQAFADSLSASATGLPILLLDNKAGTLTEQQVAFLEEHKENEFTILGGEAAISTKLENKLEELVGKDLERVYGSVREETSTAIAKRYYDSPESVVVAYSLMFPDGMCAGPLAYALNVPLLLTRAGAETTTAEYIADNGIEQGLVLGGSAIFTEDTIKTVFNMDL